MIPEINLRQKADDSHAVKLTGRNYKAISNKRKETKINKLTCSEEMVNIQASQKAQCHSVMGPAMVGCRYA